MKKHDESSKDWEKMFETTKNDWNKLPAEFSFNLCTLRKYVQKVESNEKIVKKMALKIICA